MREVVTIISGEYIGRKTMNEIYRLLGEAREYARKIKKEQNPEHIVYGYFEYKNDEIETAYINVSIKDEREFDRISRLPNYRIFAIHKL